MSKRKSKRRTKHQRDTATFHALTSIFWHQGTLRCNAYERMYGTPEWLADGRARGTR